MIQWCVMINVMFRRLARIGHNVLLFSFTRLHNAGMYDDNNKKTTICQTIFKVTNYAIFIRAGRSWNTNLALVDDWKPKKKKKKKKKPSNIRNI